MIKYLSIYCEITIENLRFPSRLVSPYDITDTYNNFFKWICYGADLETIKFLCIHFKLTMDDVYYEKSETALLYICIHNFHDKLDKVKYLCEYFEFTKKDALKSFIYLMNNADVLKYLCKYFKLTIGDCLIYMNNISYIPSQDVYDFLNICGINIKKNNVDIYIKYIATISDNESIDSILYDNYHKTMRRVLKNTDFDKIVSEYNLHDIVISYLIL